MSGREAETSDVCLADWARNAGAEKVDKSVAVAIIGWVPDVDPERCARGRNVGVGVPEWVGMGAPPEPVGGDGMGVDCDGVNGGIGIPDAAQLSWLAFP